MSLAWTVLLAFVALTSACFDPGFRECTVHCSAEGACPSGTTCASDGLCYRGESLDGVILCAARADGSVAEVDATVQPGDPDAGGQECPGGEVCDLFTQCGCTGDTACDVADLDSELYCRELRGSGMLGDRCDVSEDCAARYTCVGDQCLPWCKLPDDDCSEVGARCAVGVILDDVLYPDALVCTRGCDPMTSAGCPTGMACRIGRSAHIDDPVATCTEVGVLGAGAACGANADCAAGLSCIDFNDGAECTRNCDPDGPNTCGGGSCQSLVPPLVIGSDEFGVCA